MGTSSIGDQELSLVRHIADRGGATVGEVVASYGDARGLARSTVLTMMERLRRKGFLTRRLIDGHLVPPVSGIEAAVSFSKRL